MQIIKKCDKISPYIYMVAVFIHLAVMCGEYGVWEIPFRGRLLQLACVLCFVKILMTYYDFVEWLLLTGMGILSIVSYLFTREKYVVYVAVLIFAAKSVDMKWLLKIILDTSIVAMVTVAVLAFLGQGGMVVDVRDYGRGAVESRYCLGFNHANNLHGTFWYVISLIVILYEEKLGWIAYTVMTVLNVVLFILTASKAGFGVTMMVLLAGILNRYAKKYTFDRLYMYILGMAGYVGVIILTIVSASVSFLDGYGPVLKKLDSITTGRLNLAYQSAYIGDWMLFSDGGNHKYTVDNGFAALAADYGIVVWCVYLALIVGLVVIAAKKKYGIIFATLMSCVIYTFMERSFVLNDAYLLANLTFIVAMYLMGDKACPTVEEN